MENFRFNNCIIEFLPKMQRSKTRNHSEERLLCNFSAGIIVTSKKIYIAILFYIRCFIDLNDAIFRYYLRYWFLIDYAHVKKSITCKTLCVHLKTWSQVIKRGIDIQSDCKKCLQEIVQFATFIFFSLCPLSYITLFKFVIRPVNDNLFTLCFFQNKVLFRMVINLANAYLNIIIIVTHPCVAVVFKQPHFYHFSILGFSPTPELIEGTGLLWNFREFVSFNSKISLKSVSLFLACSTNRGLPIKSIECCNFNHLFWRIISSHISAVSSLQLTSRALWQIADKGYKGVWYRGISLLANSYAWLSWVFFKVMLVWHMVISSSVKWHNICNFVIFFSPSPKHIRQQPIVNSWLSYIWGTRRNIKAEYFLCAHHWKRRFANTIWVS